MTPTITVSPTPSPSPTQTPSLLPTRNTLEETSSINNSPNKSWWLSSGGIAYFENNLIKTIQGQLPQNSRWRNLYAQSNPLDTQGGLYPQNIFRLVSKNKYINFTQEVYFKINNVNLTDTPNRDGWSGVFLFNRYSDTNNLYYTGLRTDGAVVIKKKVNGAYYTMNYRKIFPGDYSRNDNPNLLPRGKFLGIRSEIINLDSGIVQIKLFIDKEDNGQWELALVSVDDNSSFGGAAITTEGSIGIRVDFMDVELRDYSVRKL